MAESTDTTLVVAVGEYLGRLPFANAVGDAAEIRPTVLQGGRILDQPERFADALDYLRLPRALHEIEGWFADGEHSRHVSLDELIGRGLVRTLDVSGRLAGLEQLRLHSAGASLGLADPAGDYTVLTPRGEMMRLAPGSYWFWVYSRTGQSIADVIAFVERDVIGTEAGALADDIVASLPLMLATGLGTLDSATTLVP